MRNFLFPFRVYPKLTGKLSWFTSPDVWIGNSSQSFISTFKLNWTTTNSMGYIFFTHKSFFLSLEIFLLTDGRCPPLLISSLLVSMNLKRFSLVKVARIHTQRCAYGEKYFPFWWTRWISVARNFMLKRILSSWKRISGIWPESDQFLYYNTTWLLLILSTGIQVG